MQIYFLLVSPHVLTPHPMRSDSAIENILAQWVSQYSSFEQAGVGELSPATSWVQLNTTRWRFYDGQDWDTGDHWPGAAPAPPPDHILTRASVMPRYLILSTKHQLMCWICRIYPAKTWAYSTVIAVLWSSHVSLTHNTCFLSVEKKCVVFNIM